MNWLHSLGRKLTGAEARERAEEERRIRAEAAAILVEHEARDHFGAEEVLARLTALLGEEEAGKTFVAHCSPKISAVVNAVLEDGILTPDEDAAIERVRQRYGGIEIDAKSESVLETARRQHAAWTLPLAPVAVPLLLKKNEWCCHAVRAEALEQRQRTVRVNYHGPSARMRVAKGVYYSAGSVAVDRVAEAYHHSFGAGVLGATNSRLLWVSPEKSISIPLTKIVLFEPYSDGIKIVKDSGKPLLFVFEGDDGTGAVRIARAIEELR